MSKWEKVFEDPSDADLIYRIEIEGGYLYRNVIIISGIYHVSMTFVPFAIRESRIKETEEELTRIEKLIFEGAQTHASILQCKADFKKLQTECQSLQKYIGECDQARFQADIKLEERIDRIEKHLVL